MIMLEEFRRRKQVKDYWELKKEHEDTVRPFNKPVEPLDRLDDDQESKYLGSGPERFFENQPNEIFDGSKFTMIFLDSDSVTNVTSLNRVNKRRVLIYIGNGRGMISYGKGKGEDYE